MISELIYKDLFKDIKSKKESLDVALYKMQKFFQPYFKDEIFVDHQPSDGFIIVVVFSGNDASNVNLEDAKTNIELDPNYYIDCDF